MSLSVSNASEEDNWRDMAFRSRMRAEAAEAEVERLRTALRFYSDGFAYITPEGWQAIWRDGGQTARNALRGGGER